MCRNSLRTACLTTTRIKYLLIGKSVVQTNLHPPDVDGQNSDEKEHLQEEVSGEANYRDETKLLNGRIEGQEAQSNAAEFTEQVLGDWPSLLRKA